MSKDLLAQRELENSRDFLCTLPFLESNQVLIDLRFLDEGVENVQNAVRAPNLRISIDNSQNLDQNVNFERNHT